ncbi:MAG: NADH:flavin oxidoreductase [Anaerolineae bacterium]|nr:NADH:flavin oxidoreductase [Anaerolineae bacterium]
MNYRRILSLKTAADFRTYLEASGIALGFDDEVQAGVGAPLAQPFTLKNGFTIGNRFCVLAMEGWDGTTDGHPTDLVRRRWANFGISGAKLIWGGEAAAVRQDGRANPNQLMIVDETVDDIAALRQVLVDAHQERFGRVDDLYIGLQLTHSGRFCRPYTNAGLAPKILYHHPVLDRKFGVDPDLPVMTDDEIDELVGQFAHAAVLAQRAGFCFVDIKHCHGYLGHEFLSAIDRPGKYGGHFEGRTRFLRQVVAGIRKAAPGLAIGVRLSAFDFVPFKPGPDGVGEPEAWGEGAYRYAFGGDGSGVGIDLTEPAAFMDLLQSLDIELVCITGGSPYYTPHIQRPAMFPPSDGYQPPEDPLRGVARHVDVVSELKRRHPDLAFVGSAYSYLQEWLPNVAQYAVRTGAADFVGYGRMVLPYPDMASDILEGRPLERRRICRTFSDCTTAPRKGMVSGCYPLDTFYKERPEYARLVEIKREL